MLSFKKFLTEATGRKRLLWSRFFAGTRDHDDVTSSPETSEPRRKIKWSKFFAGTKDHDEIVEPPKDVNEAYLDREMKLRNHYAKFHPHDNDKKYEEALNFYTSSSKALNKHLYTNGKFELRQEFVQHIHNLSEALSRHETPHDLIVHTGVGFSPENASVHNNYHFLEMPAFTSTSIDRYISTSFARSVKSKHVFYYSPTRKNYLPVPEHIKTRFPQLFHPDHQVSTDYSPNIVKHLTNHPDHREAVKKISQHYNLANEGHFVAPYHYLTIHVPKGSNGFYAAGHSHYSEEREFILNRNSRIAVHKKPTLITHTVKDGEAHVDQFHPYLKWKGYLVHDGMKNTPHMNRVIED
jgi:hypothetical protein